MKVFISWSGDFSRSVAVELREWLQMVVQHTNPWISSRDIEPGQKWARTLGIELEGSEFAIVCLTPENRNAPWILFEAGAIARSSEALVVPLLCGLSVKDLDGPLSQFQSVVADEAGIRRLVALLYKSSSSGLEERKRDIVFDSLWPLLQVNLDALLEQQRKNMPVQSPRDIVHTLASSPNASVDLNTLERLRDQRKRLQEQLVYLNEQEEELTRQDAPVSLQERAIAPTERELDQVQLSLKSALDRAFEKLNPAQIAYLRVLVTPRGTRIVKHIDLNLTAKLRDDEIEQLRSQRFIAIGPHGAEVTHDLVADYVATKYGGIA